MPIGWWTFLVKLDRTDKLLKSQTYGRRFLFCRVFLFRFVLFPVTSYCVAFGYRNSQFLWTLFGISVVIRAIWRWNSKSFFFSVGYPSTEWIRQWNEKRQRARTATILRVKDQPNSAWGGKLSGDTPAPLRIGMPRYAANTWLLIKESNAGTALVETTARASVVFMFFFESSVQTSVENTLVTLFCGINAKCESQKREILSKLFFLEDKQTYCIVSSISL